MSDLKFIRTSATDLSAADVLFKSLYGLWKIGACQRHAHLHRTPVQCSKSWAYQGSSNVLLGARNIRVVER